MIIEFDEMKSAIIKNFKGGQKEINVKMFNDELNRIMYSKLEPGASIGMHKHEAGSEIIYIISGTGKVLFDSGSETVKSGQCHYCPKGHSHSLINDGQNDLIFFAVVPQQ